MKILFRAAYIMPNGNTSIALDTSSASAIIERILTANGRRNGITTTMTAPTLRKVPPQMLIELYRDAPKPVMELLEQAERSGSLIAISDGSTCPGETRTGSMWIERRFHSELDIPPFEMDLEDAAPVLDMLDCFLATGETFLIPLHEVIELYVGRIEFKKQDTRQTRQLYDFCRNAGSRKPDCMIAIQAVLD